MPAGHLLFCATKKGDKKVAGNAIPRSRLPSERKIAHSRVGSLYPLNERGKEILNRTVIFHSGRTPGSGRNFRRIKRRIAGLPRGRRPARPLTRKLVFIRTVLIQFSAPSFRLGVGRHEAGKSGQKTRRVRRELKKQCMPVNLQICGPVPTVPPGISTGSFLPGSRRGSKAVESRSYG